MKKNKKIQIKNRNSKQKPTSKKSKGPSHLFQNNKQEMKKIQQILLN